MSTDALESLPSTDSVGPDMDGVLDDLVRRLEQHEGELLKLLVHGKSLREVADELRISYTAAGVRVFRLKKKVGMLLDLK
jgi:DNA-binding NarL/FixJ family response regulator